MRLFLTWIGRMLSAVAVIAVGAYFVRTQAWRTTDFRDPRLFAALTTAVLIYAAGMLATGYAWVRWVNAAGQTWFSTPTGLVIFCRTQIAKYIPGNVFHFVARQALGYRLGAPHAALALSSVRESGGHILVASLLALWGGNLPAQFSRIQRPLVVAISLVGLSIALPLSRFGKGYGAPHTVLVQLTGTVVNLIFYLGSFVGTGFCLALLLSLHHGLDLRSIPALTGIWSVCWLAGYFVPGSPGGLGVRDAALVYGLSGWCSRPEAIALALQMRVVSTLGDVFLWAVSLAGNQMLQATAVNSGEAGAISG